MKKLTEEELVAALVRAQEKIEELRETGDELANPDSVWTQKERVARWRKVTGETRSQKSDRKEDDGTTRND